jgi:hypothetical protein
LVTTVTGIDEAALLVALDLGHAEIVGVGVAEIEAAHRRAGPHRVALG